MHQFTDCRTPLTSDELWLVQHPAVYTQGQVGKAEHLLSTTDIPVIQSDRGGQITYHGIGQQVMYTLIDLRRNKINVRQLVSALEACVIQTLAELNIIAYARSDAPGVYVDNAKICSLGLRIRKGCSMHGLALNVDMDLSPFKAINPCGYVGMKMTQIKAIVPSIQLANVQQLLVDNFIQLIGYQRVELKKWSRHNYD